MPIPQLRRRIYGGISDRKEPNTNNNQHPPRRPFKLPNWNFKKVFKFVLVVAAAFFIVGTAVIAWISRDLPDPNKLSERNVAQSTKIYDRTGEHLLYEVYQNEKRTIVTLDQIAPLAVKATIAVEDKHFYEHSGIRIVSIVRAGFNNLIGRKAGSGGASTLTQQLIKNTIVGGERSYFRKIKEAILAMRLEKKYTKDEIIMMYLNEAPYGSTNLGIESASQSYFRKSAKDLTLDESATLAAMIQAPSRYLNNPDQLRNRRDLVLQLMKEQNFISENEMFEAQNSALRIYRNGGEMLAPLFIDYVKQLLSDQFGEKILDTGGLKVITTLDYDKQVAAEKIISENAEKYAKQYDANNTALVAIDPKTGQILTMVGSRDYNNDDIDGKFNVAVFGKRQPGSSFKPFVYTAAFEKGYTPDTVLYDVTTNFDQRTGGSYSPQNYDKKEHGLLTLRKALQGSLNIPAVKTLYLVGVKETIDFAKRFGYTTLQEDAGLSLVLGGSEVTLLEHTNAYATLANNGQYHPSESILKVTNLQGDTIYEWKKPVDTEAIKPELAATISSVLSDDNARAYIFGRNGNLTLPDRPVAAKTGTTNDYKDAWTMGYTPSIAVGVWVGNTIPKTMKGGGDKLAGTIWNQFMRECVKNTPTETFPTPPENDATKPVLRGADGGIKLKINSLTGKIASSSTPSQLIVERTYLLPHDILHYVIRDNPRGDYPTNPTDDPQYQNWENSLQDWITRSRAAGQEISLNEPPTEIDGPQSSELTPQIEIIFPTNNQVINNRQLDFQIKAAAPRGVTRVTYQIDENSIGTSQTYPFNLSYYAQKLTKGEHTLRVLAEDDTGNTGTAETKFFLNAEMDPPNIEWVDGESTTMKAEDFPRVMQINPFRWDSIKTVKIILTSSIDKKLIYTFSSKEDKLSSNNTLMFSWQHYPGVGEYILTAEMTDSNNRTVEKDLVVQMQ